MNPINKETIFIDGKEYYPVQQALPTPPANGYHDMTISIGKIQEYVLANNFSLTIKDRKPTRVYLKCSKGGQYKNTRKIKDEDRVRIPSSGMTGCPYLLKVSYKKGIKGYLPLKATHDIEAYHNHPLDDECLESTLKGRLSKVTVDDARDILKLIGAKTTSREIQKAINDDTTPGHKLYISDIDNMKAAFARVSAPVVENAGTKLVKAMEAKGYQVRYDVSKNGSLERIMFAHPKMLERARRFSEVMVVDATYSTNNLGMPLICVEGIHSLGGETLKSFPIAFAWVSNEQQASYLWFLEQVKSLVFEGNKSATLFVTDKCAALMNSLDIVFPENIKLLCYWHMLNSVEKAVSGRFGSVKTKEMLMEHVSSMIHSTTKEDFDLAHKKFDNISAGVDIEDGKVSVPVSVYFTNRWIRCREKWAGYLTSQYMHFGCTTTQRVKSGHQALKKGISSISSLELAFENIAKYVERLEMDFRATKIRETNRIDALVGRNRLLTQLFMKVNKRALLVIDQEVRLQENNDGDCQCKAKIQYGLPCRHTLPVGRDLHISDIPERWIINPSMLDISTNAINVTAPAVEKAEPWMEQVVQLEGLFRSCKGSQQVNELLENVRAVVAGYHNKQSHPPIKLQAPEDIKFPGRRKGSSRPKYLPKDFGRAIWRKTSILSGRAGLKAMIKLEARKRARKNTEVANVKKTQKNIKKIKQEPLDSVDASFKKWFKRPATAQDEYEYDHRTSVGKRAKYEATFPVSKEISDDVKGGFNPIPDGWCGFRVLAHLIYKDQNKFPLVKRDMLAVLSQHSVLYASTFGTDAKQLEEVIRHGSDIDSTSNSNSDNNKNTPIPACLDASMWFSTPDCAQLAADTYQRPVCVYSDNPSIPSASFLPFCLPKTKQANKQPLILNHVNNNHWTAVSLSRNTSRKWPTISPLFFLGCQRSGISDNFDGYWNRLKEFNKNDRRNAMLSLSPHPDEIVDLTNIN